MFVKIIYLKYSEGVYILNFCILSLLEEINISIQIWIHHLSAYKNINNHLNILNMKLPANTYIVRKYFSFLLVDKKSKGPTG